MTAATMTTSRCWTLVEQVAQRAATRPTDVAMRVKRLGIWDDVTWADYAEQVELVGHALLSLGIEPGDRIAIHSENRPEWLYTDLGTNSVRGITVGLYPTNPAAEVAYLLNDSGARILVAEDQEQVDKALEVEERCPELEWIIYLEPRGVATIDHPKLLGWEEFIERGRSHRTTTPAPSTCWPTRLDRTTW